MSVSQFDFYGVGAHIESSEEEFNRSLEHDFSYFLAPAPRPPPAFNF